ncbi:MAG: 23S rRNA (guanosine(2251)-2'-O)-methyltransferase RlmB [Cytophagales bacterium]
MKKPNTMIFGLHPILEAIKSGMPISKIWFKHTKSPRQQQLLSLAKQHAIPCAKVPLVKLNQLAPRHQGAVAIIAPINFMPLSHLLDVSYAKGKHPLILLLGNVQDIHNVGAIIRTALSAGADGIVVATQAGAPITGNVMKASAGALLHLPVCRVNHLTDAIHYLQKSGLQVVAMTEKAERTIYQHAFEGPTALLLGGEGQGVAPQHLKMADVMLKIPMGGPIASLNVSVAAAVVLYEIHRQRLS